MLGAIIGDIVGSPYEIKNVYKRSDVHPFRERLIPEIGKCRFTDDTVLTIAVARALEENQEEIDLEMLEKKVAETLKFYVEKYPLKRDYVNRSLYGSGFEKWAKEEELSKRSTYIDEKGHPVSTNGAAMRVASVGWMYSSIDEVLDRARSTAIYTHGSDEAIKAAQAIALSVFIARTTKSKTAIQKGLKEVLNYEIDYAKDTIKEKVEKIRNENKSRKNFAVNSDAKTTARYAIYAFLISNGFSDCIKTAISFGGDSDTIACMAGAIAEAYYGMPQWWIDKAFEILKTEGCYEDDLIFIRAFRKKYCSAQHTDEKILLESMGTTGNTNDEKTFRVVVDFVKPELEEVIGLLKMNLDEISTNDFERFIKRATNNLLGIIFDKFALIPLQFQFLRKIICDELNKEIKNFSSMWIDNLIIREFRKHEQEKPTIQISVDVYGWSYLEVRDLFVRVVKLKEDTVLKIGVSVLDIFYETLLSNDLVEVTLSRIIDENNEDICKIINEYLRNCVEINIEFKKIRCEFISIQNDRRFI